MAELQALAETELALPVPLPHSEAPGQELSQALTELQVEALGPYGLVHQPEALAFESNVAPVDRRRGSPPCPST